MLGSEYGSCCYAIRLGYERKINGWDEANSSGESKYDNTFVSSLLSYVAELNYRSRHSADAALNFILPLQNSPVMWLVLKRNPHLQLMKWKNYEKLENAASRYRHDRDTSFAAPRLSIK